MFCHFSFHFFYLVWVQRRLVVRRNNWFFIKGFDGILSFLWEVFHFLSFGQCYNMYLRLNHQRSDCFHFQWESIQMSKNMWLWLVVKNWCNYEDNLCCDIWHCLSLPSMVYTVSCEPPVHYHQVWHGLGTFHVFTSAGFPKFQ